MSYTHLVPITTNDLLKTICDEFSLAPFVTVDTEFMRETTYYPKLCLIQIASENNACLIDPLAPNLDLTPFLDLMKNRSVLKVFHSARQDLEIIWNMGNLIPSPLFDTQIAAMVCGYGDSVSYEQLANDLAKAKVDKSSRFTDWSRRPLSEAQLSYALSDVTHLIKVYQALHTQLEQSGRLSWLDEEMAILSSPDTYRADPAFAWKRLSGRMRKPKEIAVLMELAAWREKLAQERDVPRGRILKDETIIDLASSHPVTKEGLGRLRTIPNGFENSAQAQEILGIISQGLERETKDIVMPHRARRGGTGAIVDLLKVLLKAVADQEKVAPKILASSDDLDDIADNDDADVPALKGWRHDVFGEKALALKNGQMALSVVKGQVTLTLVSNV